MSNPTDQQTESAWQPATFHYYVDGSPSWEGLTCGRRWREWHCPFFTKVAAEQILSWDYLNLDWRYVPAEDAYYSRSRYDETGEWERWEGVEIDGVTHYPIGAFSWWWCANVDDNESNNDGKELGSAGRLDKSSDFI